MAQLTLEERIATLEQQVAGLLANGSTQSHEKDWRRTIGIFTGNETMKQIDEATRKIREEDRRRARRQQAKSKRTKARQGKR